jgi:hypothetical protein
MIYEYLPGLASSFQKVTPIWLDITGCGDSEEPAKNDTTFQYTSPVWTANASGRIAATIGHLHDGGMNLDITQNNSTMCDFAAAYVENPGYIDASAMNMPGMPMGNMGMQISSFSECSTGQVNLGDNLSVTAFYNTTEYTPMTDTDGSLAPIMGIALLYWHRIRRPPTVRPVLHHHRQVQGLLQGLVLDRESQPLALMPQQHQ